MAIEAGLDPQNLIGANDSNDIIKLLQNGTIDAWSILRYRAYGCSIRFGIKPGQYETVYNLGGDFELYCAFNKQMPDSLVHAFQSALNQIKQEKNMNGISDYAKILYKYLPVRYCKKNVSLERRSFAWWISHHRAIESDAPGHL